MNRFGSSIFDFNSPNDLLLFCSEFKDDGKIESVEEIIKIMNDFFKIDETKLKWTKSEISKSTGLPIDKNNDTSNKSNFGDSNIEHCDDSKDRIDREFASYNERINEKCNDIN